MGIEVLAGAALFSAAAGTAQAIDSGRRQKHEAQDAAKREREALAALQSEPMAPAAMPVADDQAVRQARRRSIASQLGRRGRSSTILTDSNTADSLGA